jgi:hypothetical protein
MTHALVEVVKSLKNVVEIRKNLWWWCPRKCKLHFTGSHHFFLRWVIL